MRVLAIGGLPGVGKTTFLLNVVSAFGPGVPGSHGLLKYMRYSRHRTCVLGVYDGAVFAGTDKLSMAVQPDADRFIATEADAAEPFNVVFEGDRLFNGKFLQTCADRLDLELMVVVLVAAPDVLSARCAARVAQTGVTQDETWRRGRRTKIQNIRALCGGEAWDISDDAAVDLRVKEAREWLGLR